MTSTPSIKVYGPASSSSVQRVLVALYEKNLEFQIVPINIGKGESKTPEYLKLQPFGQVPALQYGPDITLFESRAIVRSVARKFEGQGTALYGTISSHKAFTEQYLEVESQNFNRPSQRIVSSTVSADGKSVLEHPTIDDATLRLLLNKVEAVLDVYEARLSSNKYLAGDFFSLADLVHLPNLHNLINVAKKGEVLESRPAVKAWWEDISSRPAWKKTLQLSA